MKFLFEITFYPIAFIIVCLFLCYNPVGTSIFLAVFFLIVIIGAVLVYRYKNKGQRKLDKKRFIIEILKNIGKFFLYGLLLTIAILRELIRPKNLYSKGRHCRR